MKQEDKIKCIVSDNGTIIPINTIAAISGKNCIHHIWTNRDQDHEGYRLSDEQYNILMKELKILSNDLDEKKHIEEIFPKFKVGDIVRNIDSGELFHIEKVDSRNYWDGRDSFYIIDQKQWEHFKQKSSWSKEDEMQLDAAIHLVSNTGHIETANWLKALKNRILQQNITITDEELAKAKKDAYNHALDKIEYHSGEPTFDDGWSAATDYIKKKSLKNRVQSQQGWSEEDKIIRNALIKFVELLYSYGSGIYNLDKNQFLDWLQKLENRIVSK